MVQSTNLCVLGFYKINKREVNAGKPHEYSTKAELETVHVNVRKRKKQNIRHMVTYMKI